MTQKRIYLSGPITGLSYREARHGWREVAAQMITNSMPGEVEILSPMRAKRHLADHHDLSPMGDPNSILSCPRGITTRDRYDTMRCDLMLVNLLGAERISIGTMIEFGWADAARVPIVCAIEPMGNLHEHAISSDLIGFRCPTLEEAALVAIAILKGGV